MFFGVFAENIPPFDQFSLPEIAFAAAAARASTLHAAAAVEPAAAIPARSTFASFMRLRAFPAVSAGSRTSLVLELLLFR